MRIGTYAAALGAVQQQKRLDVIANNLANANTAGYKRDEARFEDFVNESTFTQYDQGPIRTTDNPLDIALEGKGYLKLQSKDGPLYTRAGNLTVSRDKFLTTQDGLQVLGKNGPIQLTSTNIRITPEGQVFDGDTAIDSLDLVQFPDQTPLLKGNSGYLKPQDNTAKPTPATGCSVQQGALESANFNVVEEMARMVDTVRIFEAYQKVLQTSGQDLDGQLISKLGNA